MAHPACNCSVSNLCWGVPSAIVESEGRAGWRRGERGSPVYAPSDKSRTPRVSRYHVVQSKRLTVTRYTIHDTRHCTRMKLTSSSSKWMQSFPSGNSRRPVPAIVILERDGAIWRLGHRWHLQRCPLSIARDIIRVVGVPLMALRQARCPCPDEDNLHLLCRRPNLLVMGYGDTECMRKVPVPARNTGEPRLDRDGGTMRGQRHTMPRAQTTLLASHPLSVQTLRREVPDSPRYNPVRASLNHIQISLRLRRIGIDISVLTPASELSTFLFNMAFLRHDGRSAVTTASGPSSEESCGDPAPAATGSERGYVRAEEVGPMWSDWYEEGEGNTESRVQDTSALSWRNQHSVLRTTYR